MRKIFASIFAVSLLLTQSIALADVAPPKDPFTDVRFGKELFAPAADRLKDAGIIIGYANGSFKPHNQINRAEFLKIVMTASHQSEVDEAVKIFTLIDIKPGNCLSKVLKDLPCYGAWFTPYVNVAFEKKIIAGYPDKTFRASSNINFGEASKVVLSAFGYQVAQGVTPWYKSSIDTLNSYITVPSTVKGPGHLLTRAEMVQIIASMMDYHEAQTYKNNP